MCSGKVMVVYILFKVIVYTFTCKHVVLNRGFGGEKPPLAGRIELTIVLRRVDAGVNQEVMEQAHPASRAQVPVPYEGLHASNGVGADPRDCPGQCKQSNLSRHPGALDIFTPYIHSLPQKP